MLTLYLIAGIIGGSLIVLSAVGGLGDNDVELDHDVDLDLDHDVDVDMDHDVDHALDVPGAGALDAVDAEGVWLPFFSLRFWTYFAAGFGVTGGILTWLGSVGEPVLGLMAGGTGLVAGTAMAYAMRALKKGEAHGNVSTRDYQGAEGTVIVAIGPGGTGKVRTRVRGEEIDLLATSDETELLEKGAAVIVIEVVGPQARVMRRETVLGD